MSAAEIAYLLLVGSQRSLCDGRIVSRNRWRSCWADWSDWRLPSCASAVEIKLLIINLKNSSRTNRWTTNSKDGPALTMQSCASLWRRVNRSVELIRTTASPALSPALSAILPVLTCKKNDCAINFYSLSGFYASTCWPSPSCATFCSYVQSHNFLVTQESKHNLLQN